MNINVNRNDFLFFQNEVYKDLKELEFKLNEKLNTITSNINSNKEISDNNYQKFTEKISQMITMIETSEERLKIDEKISSFKKKIDDFIYMNKAKTTAIEKEIDKITFKYDKIFLDNLTVPGVIGTACPFQNLSSFIEFTNKKIKELLIEKNKQNTDMRSYKEKLETMIGAFNKQIKNVETQFAEFCNNSFQNFDKNCNERNNLLEEKIQNMRIENGKYSFDLIQKSKELKIEWEKIQNIQDDIYNRFNKELSKHVHTSNNLCRIFNSQRDEFKLLKSRFTELSEFIKDVRFRNNLNNSIHETEFEKKLKFRNMSKRINFNLKQKLNINEKNDNSLDKINKYDYFETNTEKNFNHSFSDFSENNNNKYKRKKNVILNKPMNLGKVSSTLKNYFNQNREFKAFKQRNNNIDFNFIDNKNEYKSENEKKEKETDEEEVKIKPILKKRNALQSAKDIIKKNKNLIFTIEDNKNKKNNQNDSFNLNTKQEIINKSSKLLPMLPLKKECLSNITISNDKSRNIFIKPKKRGSLFTEFNKNLIIEKLDDNIGNTKGGSSKYLNTYFPDIMESKDFSPFNSPNQLNIEIPTFNKIEKMINSINSIINKNNNDKEKVNLIDINTLNDNNNNLNTISSKNKKKMKNKNFSNYFDLNNFENDKKSVIKNKFSFLTNIKESPKKTINDNNNNNELNINFYLLNKKISKTNKRMNEIYQEVDTKYNKLYKYVKKLFGDLTGKLFFKQTNNYNLFNSDFSQKTIFTTSNLIMPIPNKVKKPLHLNEIDKIINEKKVFSPKNLKKIDSFKSIVNKIEPYLIKKFKT